MNEKEAREHLENKKKTFHFPHGNCSECYRAEGYLEAIEKAKGLVECAKEIQHTELCQSMTPYRGCTCGKKELDEAIAKWEKEK